MIPRRHPADVTADRLVHDYEKWFGTLTGSERDAIGTAIQALRWIADNEQGEGGE